MENLWMFAVVGGPILLAVALIWARTRNRVSPRQEAETERATQRLYEEESCKDDAKAR